MDLFSDPFDLFNSDRLNERQLSDRKKELRRSLNPVEEESALKRYLGGGLSGLAWAGGVLDKTFGGRAIRSGVNALAGGGLKNPSELLSFIPGSDTMGLTDQANAVSGEDILKTTGVLEGEGEKGSFEARDLLGPALEIGLDPATYLTFGASALSKPGVAAKKIGALPKSMLGRISGFSHVDDLARASGKPLADITAEAAKVGVNVNDLVGKPLGGLAGLKLPFADEGTGILLGTGDRAKAVAGALGKARDYAMYSRPGALLSAGFDKTVQGSTDPLMQRIYREREAERLARAAKTRGKVVDVASPLLENGAYEGDQFTPIRSAFEGVTTGPLPADLDNATQKFLAADKEALDYAKQAGVPVDAMESMYGTRHAGRSPTPLNVDESIRTRPFKEPNLNVKTGPTLQRMGEFDMPGGTEAVNRAVMDARVSTQARQVKDAAGNLIPRLTKDTPGFAGIEAAVKASFNSFTGDQLNRLVALRQSATTAAERAERKALEKALRKSTQGVNRAIREGLLGAKPGELAATGPWKKSVLQQMERQAPGSGFIGPLPADFDTELNRLRGMKSEADFITRRVRGLRTEGALKQTGDAAEQVIPAINKARQDRAAAATLLDEYFGYNPKRHDQLRGVVAPLEEAVSGAANAADRKAAKQTLEAWLTSTEGQEYKVLNHAEESAPKLASYLGELDPERLTTGLFANDPLLDSRRGWESLDTAAHRANVATDYLGRSAVRTRTPEAGMVPIAALAREVGLTEEAVKKIVGDVSGRTGRPLGVKDMRNLYVGADQAKAIRGQFAQGELPEFLKPVVDKIDSFTSMFKGLQTSPWPAFHARNMASSGVQSLQHGAKDVFGSGRAMAQLRAGETIPGIAGQIPYLAGMSDEEATKALGRLMFTERAAGHNVVGGTRDMAWVDGSGPKTVGDLIPGVKPDVTFGDAMTGRKLDTAGPVGALANPFNLEGVGGRNQTKFIPAQWGRQMGNWVDDVNRGGMFIDMLKQGYTPTAAADLTQAAHLDYSGLSGFERNVMRRLVPFYSWQRQAIPQQLGVLARNPGGATANAIRLTNDLRQSEGFLPPYLGGGMAVPMGGEEDGTQRYLTKLDMPWETPFDPISTGPGGMAKTLMKTLGNLTPLVKGPLEVATNRQFYSGRELDDLYSRTGIPLVDQVLMNSPFGRAGTTAHSLLLDKRKWDNPAAIPINLLTGARVSDVDMVKQRQIAMGDIIRDYLRDQDNVSTFDSFYVRPEDMGRLSEKEIELMRLNATLEKRQKEAVKAKKAAPAK